MSTMKSEIQELKEEIRYVKEILAQQDKMANVGYSKLLDAEQDITIPPQYSYLMEQKRSSLERHMKRLQQDLEDLERRNDASEFNRKVELRRGKRVEDEEDGEK